MANAPVDPKVVAGGAAAGVAGAAVVLLLNVINKEPLNQVALETLLTAIVVFVLGLSGGWLKRTPLNVLQARELDARVTEHQE